MLRKIIFYILLIITWELVYRLGVEVFQIWKPYAFPSPINVIKSIITLAREKVLFIALFATLKRLFVGYILSIILGALLGIVIIKYKYIEENIKPLILGLQTLPSVCWVPVAILWYGLSESSILFVIVMGSTFSITIAMESAVRNINPIYVKAARTMGCNGVNLYKEVILPAALPTIISGLKQGFSFAFRALIAGEIISSSKGLGHTLMVGRDLGDISQVVAIMIIIIMIGFTIENLVFGRLEKSVRQKWGLDNN